MACQRELLTTRFGGDTEKRVAWRVVVNPVGHIGWSQPLRDAHAGKRKRAAMGITDTDAATHTAQAATIGMIRRLRMKSEAAMK